MNRRSPGAWCARAVATPRATPASAAETPRTKTSRRTRPRVARSARRENRCLARALRAVAQGARVLHRHERARALDRHEVGAEGLAHALELGVHLRLGLARPLLESREAVAGPAQLVLELEHPLDPGQVEAELGRHLLDAAKALDVLLG